MNMKATTALAAMLLLSAMPQQAKANDLANIARDLLGSNYGRSFTPEQDRLMNNLDARMSQLQAQIRNADRANQISEEQASDLSAELDRVAERERRFLRTDGQLSFGEMQNLLSDLNNVESHLNMYVAHGGDMGPGFDRYFTGSDAERRLAAIQMRINRGRETGELSQREYVAMRNEVKAIQAVIDGWRDPNGDLTAYKRNLINQRIANLNGSLNQNLHDSERSFASGRHDRMY